MSILKTRKLNEAQSDLNYYSGCAGKIIRWDEVSSSDVGLSGLINGDNGYATDTSVQARLTIYDANKNIANGTEIATTLNDIFTVLETCAIKQKYLIDNSTGDKITVKTALGFNGPNGFVYMLERYNNKAPNFPILSSITICYNASAESNQHVKVYRDASEFGMMPNWTSFYNAEWRKIRTISSNDNASTVKSKLGSLGNISRMKQLAESGMSIVSKTSEQEPTDTDQTEINDNFGMIYVTYYGKKSSNTFLLRYVAFERPTENKKFYAPNIETIIVWYDTSHSKWVLTEGRKTFINDMLYLGSFSNTTDADSTVEQAALYVDTCPIIYYTVNGSERNEPRGVYVRQRKFKFEFGPAGTNDRYRVVEQIMYRDEYQLFKTGNAQKFSDDVAVGYNHNSVPTIWSSGYHIRHVYLLPNEREIYTGNLPTQYGSFNDTRGWHGLFDINESTKHRLHEVICGWQRFNTDNSRQFRPLTDYSQFNTLNELITYLDTLPYNNYNDYNNTNDDTIKSSPGWDLSDWGDAEYDKTENGVWFGQIVKQQNACRNRSGYGKFMIKLANNENIYYLTLSKLNNTTETLMYLEGAGFKINVDSNGKQVISQEGEEPSIIYRYGKLAEDNTTKWSEWQKVITIRQVNIFDNIGNIDNAKLNEVAKDVAYKPFVTFSYNGIVGNMEQYVGGTNRVIQILHWGDKYQKHEVDTTGKANPTIIPLHYFTEYDYKKLYNIN